MAKAPLFPEQGASTYTNLIVCGSIIENQAQAKNFSYFSHILRDLIAQKRLTDLLEFLEQRGFTEERALLMLVYLQGFGGKI